MTGEVTGPFSKWRFGFGRSRRFHRVAPVEGSRPRAHCLLSVSAAVNASPLASTTALFPHPTSTRHSSLGPSGGHSRTRPLALYTLLPSLGRKRGRSVFSVSPACTREVVSTKGRVHGATRSPTARTYR